MNKIVTFLVAIALLMSCSLDREPKGYATKEKILEEPGKVIGDLVNGVYAQLKAWSDPMHRCGEYAGDNIMIRGASTDPFFEFITFSRTPNNDRLQSFWDNSYKAIAQASNIVEMLGASTDREVKEKIGECYFVRGLLYFYLVRAFGRPYYQAPETNLGVPVVTQIPKNVLGDFSLPDRMTVEKTYEQAIADLKKAEELLPSASAQPFRGSKEAAQALLSRVYLYMSGTYDQPNVAYAKLAVEYATKVISSGKYALLPRDEFMKYNTILPENNKESIFVIRRLASEFSGYDHYYGVGGMYANIGGMGWGEMYASAKYLALLDETGRNDYRPDQRRIVDARAAFIEPVYKEGNKEVFRFIKTEGSGDQNYLQLPTKHTGGKITVSETITDGNNQQREITYELTAVNAAQGIYSINYKGTTYQGVLDYDITLNRAYPMFYITKCSREGEDSHLHSPVISRLAEIYLNRAEAEAKLGNYSAALSDLNQVRTRSLPSAAYSSLDATTAATRIDKERQLELAFQAERSYDVFRNGGSLVRRYPGAHNQTEDIAPTDYRVIYFIPQNAINSYPGKLTQNPTH